jgi:hypothetical protein
VKNATRLLVLLGIAAQLIVVYGFWHELSALSRGYTGGLPPEAAPLFLLPTILGFGGAAAARALHRRGSGWAWPVLVVPLIILMMVHGAALYLAIYPPPMHGGSGRLPL